MFFTRKKVDNSNYIDALPEEVLQHILSFLGRTDLARCSMINKKWQRIANDDQLWKLIFQGEQIHKKDFSNKTNANFKEVLVSIYTKEFFKKRNRQSSCIKMILYYVTCGLFCNKKRSKHKDFSKRHKLLSHNDVNFSEEDRAFHFFLMEREFDNISRTCVSDEKRFQWHQINLRQRLAFRK